MICRLWSVQPTRCIAQQTVEIVYRPDTVTAKLQAVGAEAQAIVTCQHQHDTAKCMGTIARCQICRANNMAAESCHAAHQCPERICAGMACSDRHTATPQSTAHLLLLRGCKCFKSHSHQAAVTAAAHRNNHLYQGCTVHNWSQLAGILVTHVMQYQTLHHATQFNC